MLFKNNTTGNSAIISRDINNALSVFNTTLESLKSIQSRINTAQKENKVKQQELLDEEAALADQESKTQNVIDKISNILG